MRKFSPNVERLLELDNFTYFHLIKVHFKDAVVQITTLPYSVTVGALGYFNADHNLVKLDAPQLTSVVDRAAYKLIFADPDFEFKERFDVGAVGCAVQVFAGFFNGSEEVIGGAQPGQPLLNPEDIVVLYGGIIDSHGYTRSDEGEVLATIECASPMASLGAKNTFLTTDSVLRNRNPNDSSFEGLHEGSASVNIGWGKMVS